MLFQAQILCNLNATNREALSFFFFPMIHALHALFFSKIGSLPFKVDARV